MSLLQGIHAISLRAGNQELAMFRVSLVLLFAGGCIVGDSGGGSAPKISLDVGDEKGIDYAWSHPSSPQALKNAGYTFVARYLSYDTTGKNLTAGEAQGLNAAGIDIVANWEWDADDALNGYNTGVSDAQQA